MVKALQRVVAPVHLDIDPWKASRTPSARFEPAQRTRFKSPVNASASRVSLRTRSASLTGHRHSTSDLTKNQLLSPISCNADQGATSVGTTSTSYFVDSGFMSPNSLQQHSSLNSYLSPLSSSPSPPKPSQTPPHYHYHVQQSLLPKSASNTSESYLTRDNYINSSCRQITLQTPPKPGKLPRPSWLTPSPS